MSFICSHWTKPRVCQVGGAALAGLLGIRVLGRGSMHTPPHAVCGTGFQFASRSTWSPIFFVVCFSFCLAELQLVLLTSIVCTVLQAMSSVMQEMCAVFSLLFYKVVTMSGSVLGLLAWESEWRWGAQSIMQSFRCWLRVLTLLSDLPWLLSGSHSCLFCLQAWQPCSRYIDSMV